jgi:ubiquinone/menaquinone biosynthesis C-methylase UbiE
VKFTTGILLVCITFIAIGLWWRYRSLACPASLIWLIENPYMNAVAGPEKIFQRAGLEQGMKLLDVGSGPGRLALPASKLVGATGEVVALDIQPGMLNKLKARAKVMGIENIRLIHAAAGSGKTDKEYFDRAILVTVLGEIPNKLDALTEVNRALKPGGIMSITEVIPDPHFTGQKKVRSLCKDAGFEEMALFDTKLGFTINFIKPVAA